MKKIQALSGTSDRYHSIATMGQIIRPLSCGFDSSVGRALHRHRRGRGLKSRSGPEFFSGLCSSSVTAALALMTVITQLLLWDKLLSS